MDRKRYDSGSPWEPVAGYSRAVRVGRHVHVSGTTATTDDGTIDPKGDPRGQTLRALENIGRALESFGASLSDVVRTRMFVTHGTPWEEVARAHGDVFAEIRPASTLVLISGLVDPDMLVEIEAEAILPEPADTSS